MKIEIKVGANGYDECHEMYINDKKLLSVYSLSECPEDAIIGRSLVDCFDVYKFMQLAYEAGKNNELLEFVESKIKKE